MTQRTPHPLTKLTRQMLPFADAASRDLPIGQLLRLSLFQVSVGLASVMLLGTLNRVMIVELSVPAMIVAIMIALPVLIAPFRALIGFRSDTYRSAIGWKRVPFIWFGSLWQMGGLAVMPFALLVLSGDQTVGPSWAGEVLAALAFLMTGLGLHMTQTAGLALASDRATEETRPRVVALLYVMYLLGMGLSALLIGWLLTDFSNLTLIRVIQGAALAGLLLNLIALWKQEHVSPMSKEQRAAPRPSVYGRRNKRTVDFGCFSWDASLQHAGCSVRAIRRGNPGASCWSDHLANRGMGIRCIDWPGICCAPIKSWFNGLSTNV